MEEEDEDDIEIPKDARYEYKHVVLLGRKPYVFETEEEGNLFFKLVQRKHIMIEDALKYIEEMRAKRKNEEERIDDDLNDDEMDYETR